MLPIAYGGCDCECHTIGGIMHFMACCSPYDEIEFGDHELCRKSVKLKGNSAKGKQRIKRDGNIWTIVKVWDKVLFSAEKGPWLLITNGDMDKSRWVHMFNDQNFRVSVENG